MTDDLKARRIRLAREANQRRAMAGRAHAPQLRCGICDEQLHPDEETAMCDGERCHVECIESYDE